MLEYPSISSEVRYDGGPYFLYDKLDGMNVRAEWSKKRGFYKLGARHTHLADQWRDEVQELIDFQKDGIVEGFRKLRWERAICFFEFYGEKSLAGVHVPRDIRMVALLDVSGPDDRILDPRDFFKLFYGRVQTPRLLGRGGFNREIEEEIRSGVYPGMTFEGVVVKGPPVEKEGNPVFFKCKNRAWIERVKNLYGDKAKDLL